MRKKCKSANWFNKKMHIQYNEIKQITAVHCCACLIACYWKKLHYCENFYFCSPTPVDLYQILNIRRSMSITAITTSTGNDKSFLLLRSVITGKLGCKSPSVDAQDHLDASWGSGAQVIIVKCFALSRNGVVNHSPSRLEIRSSWPGSYISCVIITLYHRWRCGSAEDKL